MSSINEVLQLLADGEWHTLTEVSKALKISFEELDSIIHFLSKYGFIEVGDDLIKVKIDKGFEELITEEFTQEHEVKKPKPAMLMTIKGEFQTIECTETEMVVTGQNLEIESMRKEKEVKEIETKTDVINVSDVLNTLRFLVDNEWHRYDEITSKLQFTTEKLLKLIQVLRENDLVVVHDKFGMLRLRQEVKIKP
jgi:DNA-binding IclR family transcriptional regulator